MQILLLLNFYNGLERKEIDNNVQFEINFHYKTIEFSKISRQCQNAMVKFLCKEYKIFGPCNIIIEYSIVSCPSERAGATAYERTSFVRTSPFSLNNVIIFIESTPL